MSLELYNFLMKIKEMPGLYLGKSSLIYLKYFINGYSFRDWERNKDGEPFINAKEFEKYVTDMYGYDLSDPFKMTTRDSFGLIADDSVSDEEAFFKFFTILESYVKTTNPIC